MKESLRGRRAYFDTNVFIYRLEGFAGLERSLQDIRDCILHGEAAIFTSELTLCEVLMQPLRANDSGLITKYRQLIEHSGAFALLPTTRETYIRTSLLSAQYGLKTPDALHLASAMEAS